MKQKRMTAAKEQKCKEKGEATAANNLIIIQDIQKQRWRRTQYVGESITFGTTISGCNQKGLAFAEDVMLEDVFDARRLMLIVPGEGHSTASGY